MAPERSHGAAGPAQASRLAPSSGGDVPSSTARLTLIEPLHVLSVRVLPGADPAWHDILRGCGVTRLPSPGRCEGDAVRVLWRSPSEYWFVSQHPDRLAGLIGQASPGAHADACAVDHSEGTAGIELGGEDIDAVLARLMDASAIPAAPGQATRARCADLAVALLRIDERRLWLLVERPLLDYMMDWLHHALEQVRSARSP